MRSPTLFLAAVLLAAGPVPTQAAVSAAGPGAAPTSDRVLVVELFSSQACASCPAANAVVAELAQGDATVLPLDLHVTYFDRAGWKDRDSLPAASQRQQRYVAQLGTPGVYTPQVVVGGRHEALGYDAPAVQAAVALARGEAGGVPLGLSIDPAGLRVQAGAGQGRGTLWLVGFDGPARRRGPGVNPGINPGVNTVRALQEVGGWHGAPVSLTAAAPRGARTAVLLQDDRGAILAAALLR